MALFAIAGLQQEVHARDNVEDICDEVIAVKKRFPWVDMILLAELAAYGAGVKHAEPRGGRAEQAFMRAAQEAGVWLIPGSLYETDGPHIYNTAPVINPKGYVVARYRKMYPFLPYEKDVGCGDEFVVFDVPHVGRFGVSICYDMWFPETTRALAFKGAEVILHPSLTNTVDRDVELSIARTNAAVNQCYFFDINCAAPVGNGRSIVVGPGGEVLHQAGDGKEVIPVEIDLGYVRRVREEGWNKLGQPLKSFRDTPVTFPQYNQRDDAPFLQSLGPLKVPSAT